MLHSFISFAPCLLEEGDSVAKAIHGLCGTTWRDGACFRRSPGAGQICYIYERLDYICSAWLDTITRDQMDVERRTLLAEATIFTFPHSSNWARDRGRVGTDMVQCCAILAKLPRPSKIVDCLGG